MSAYDPTETLRRMKCPYLYIDCGQPDLDLDLVRELSPQVVIGKTVGAGHKALRDVPDQINAMLNRFIQHADAIAAEMIRTGGVFQYNFPELVARCPLPVARWTCDSGRWTVSGTRR